MNVRQIDGLYYYSAPGKSGEFARIYGPFLGRESAECDYERKFSPSRAERRRELVRRFWITILILASSTIGIMVAVAVGWLLVKAVAISTWLVGGTATTVLITALVALALLLAAAAFLSE
jgi:sterol desaturase/sphingolipid hydroxylase (fatty acid hydroxylase superfamily)